MKWERSKNGKNVEGPGTWGINLKLLKYGEEKVITLITRLINSIIREENIPEEINRMYIISIHK